MVSFLLAGCSPNRFPRSPERYRHYREVEAAPYDYYSEIRSGITSRVVNMQPNSDARIAAEQVAARWREIDRIDSTDDIVEYLNVHGLSAVGDRIHSTIRRRQPERPPQGINERLEAAAVKQALVDAVFELRSQD